MTRYQARTTGGALRYFLSDKMLVREAWISSALPDKAAHAALLALQAMARPARVVHAAFVSVPTFTQHGHSTAQALVFTTMDGRGVLTTWQLIEDE